MQNRFTCSVYYQQSTLELESQGQLFPKRRASQKHITPIYKNKNRKKSVVTLVKQLIKKVLMSEQILLIDTKIAIPVILTKGV